MWLFCFQVLYKTHNSGFNVNLSAKCITPPHSQRNNQGSMSSLKQTEHFMTYTKTPKMPLLYHSHCTVVLEKGTHFGAVTNLLEYGPICRLKDGFNRKTFV